MMKSGSKTFFAASHLLPLRIRAASVALYAFCRVADDLVDQGHNSCANLAILRHRLDNIYCNQPSAAAEDQALALVVQQYHLPRLFLDALLEGFAWDALGQRYQSLDELLSYAARVAGSVGAMMCWIMGARTSSTLARACELGVAMQLTNIARDIGEDARNGRIYLPLQWLQEAGVDPESWLQQPQPSAAIKNLIARLLDEADTLYQKAQTGIVHLPPDCRAAILAASAIYSEIGAQLRRDGLDSVNRRTVVGTARKLVLLASTWSHSKRMPAATETPAALPAIAFLLETANLNPQSHSSPNDNPNPATLPRVEWVLSLLERLENERMGRRPVSLSE